MIIRNLPFISVHFFPNSTIKDCQMLGKKFRYIISITVVLNHVKFCPPGKDSLLQCQEVERNGNILLASCCLKPGALPNIPQDNSSSLHKKISDSR